MRRALVLFLCAATVTGCGAGAPGPPVARLGEPAPTFSRAGWSTDFARHRVPFEEIRNGGLLPRDAIRPIDRPRAVAPGRAKRSLAGREPVIAVEAGGAARAYPVRTLVLHEIVNDRLGEVPIAVTYCPLCNSSLVFDRRVGRRELSFGTTGDLRRSNLVMWDRQTESWWQQATAEAIVGELTGARLRRLPAQTLSWRRFRQRYPRGDVLSPVAGDQDGFNPYLGYDVPASRPHLLRGPIDPRLPPKERVVALLDGRPPIAVSFSRLAGEPVVELDLDRTPAVVLYERGVASPIDADAVARSRDVGTAAAFDRRLGARTLSFARRGGRFVDRQTGSSWDLTGRATAGRLRGARLRPLRHDERFWFALAAFAPDARIAGGR